MIRGFSILLAIGLLFVAGACDPCAGTVSCETGPSLRATGRIVAFPSGEAVSGVRITITAAGATTAATSDGDGFWAVELPAPADASAEVTASADVLAPGAAVAYHVDALKLPVVRRRGDGIDLGRWYSHPELRFIGELRARPGINLTGASVQADRTGGADGTVAGVKATVSTGGQFYLEAPARATGIMTLRLTITGPRLSRAYVRDGVQVRVMHRDTVPGVQGTYAVGIGLPYVVRIFRRGPDTPLAGVTAVFRRKSGVSVAVDTITSVSTVDGLVSLQLSPNGSGELVGDLELRPPSPIPARTITNIRIGTVEDDSLRLAGVFGVGVQVRYAYDFFMRSALVPAASIDAEFRPTSGPLVTTIVGRSGTDGRFGVTAAVNAAGTVVGDLTVRYLPPRAPEVRSGLRLIAANDDSVRSGGVFGVGPSLLYVGTVQDIVGFTAITSGTAEFRRTGGIAVQEAVFSWPINTFGLYRMSPTPLADGEVVGDLTFRLPLPYRDTTFTNVRMTTFTNDSTRVGPVFRVHRP